MRVLFLTYHLPFPPISGGRRREYELLTRLGEKFEIHLCCVSKTYSQDRAYVEQVRPYCAEVSLFKANDSLKLFPVPRELTAITHRPPPFQVLRHTSLECAAFIPQALQEKHYDIAHVEGYYMMQYLSTSIYIPTLLIEQNIEYLLCLQRLTAARTQRDKMQHAYNYACTLEWEQYAWQRATMCAVVTKEEQRFMVQTKPEINVMYVPNGVDHCTTLDHVTLVDAALARHDKAREFLILFVGNFAYEPNIDAIQYFVEDIFPRILREVPNVRLFVVGNAPPPTVLALRDDPQVVVTGLVRSLEAYLAHADVVVCPLRVGGGIKVKILEALKAGKAIVSTSVGAQGIENPHQFMRIADDASDFVSQVIRLLLIPHERKRLEEAARDFARRLPTWDEAAEALSSCYEQLGASTVKKPAKG